VLTTAQTGITMEALLTALENAGLGVTATPAPGDVTLGGVLAIGGHGTAIPAVGEQPTAGHTFGSLSNLILSLTAGRRTCCCT
jgi:FAD/FMN-containing dehydrogenase